MFISGSVILTLEYIIMNAENINKVTDQDQVLDIIISSVIILLHVNEMVLKIQVIHIS